jgi:hypothetical protein
MRAFVQILYVFARQSSLLANALGRVRQLPGKQARYAPKISISFWGPHWCLFGQTE